MARPADALRIAICFGTFPPERNGGADFLGRFSGALAAEGCDVHVITSRTDSPETETLRSGVVVHRIVDDWTIRSGRESLRQANRVLAAAEIDVFHVLFPESTIQARYQLPALIGLRQTPLVTTWWNLGLGRRSPFALKLESAALLARSRVITSHDPRYLAQLRRIALGAKPVRWLPVGSNFTAVHPKPRGEGPITLGYFGQLDFTRGVDTLFEALALVGRRDLRLVMIGSAGRPERYADDPAAETEFRRLLELPAHLGIADRVEWTDYLDDEAVIETLAGIDLFVLPYRRNSLGRSALAAALASGRPVLLGGSPDGIAPLRSPEHVALVRPDDPTALAAEIRRLVDDPGARSQLAAGAREASEFFSWPRIARRAIELYREALR